MFREALEAFFAAFDRYTLVDLLDRETGLRASLRLLPPAAALEV
jgi:hypothetical protein